MLKADKNDAGSAGTGNRSGREAPPGTGNISQAAREEPHGRSMAGGPAETPPVRQLLLSLWRFLLFFMLIAFIVSCSFLLFFHSVNLDEAAIRERAPITFANVLLLCLIFSLVDSMRRKYMVDKPVRHILEATHRLAGGDFSTRIRPLDKWAWFGAGNYNAIIEDFNKMAEELSGTETLKTDFIVNVSHELKTPLAVIQNYATLLQSPRLPEDQRLEYARATADAARRLSGLITNILKLNKLENQQIFPDVREYDLGEQLRECLLSFEDVWERKHLEIDAESMDDIWITADPELMSLVWNNLISNAVKFTPEGGRITVSLSGADGWAQVKVTDTGCGMGPEVGRHIFEKFYQGDASHAAQGNGLGLTLVRRVVDIVGGEISVESTPGEGSTFTVRLKWKGI